MPHQHECERDEIIVLPTRAMGPDDADYAVSFAMPVDTPALSLYVSAYGARDRNEFEFPVSSKHKMLETLTVFDDVFVPWDRVFLCREPELGRRSQPPFVEYHRFTAVSYKLPLLDALVGTAALIAEMNGVEKAGHIRDKLTQLVIYAETVRALTHMAATRATVDDRGFAAPDPLTTNLAKYTFATRYHPAVELVQDCAGGLLVTGPGGDDWANPEVRAVLEKFYAAKAPAEERLRLLTPDQRPHRSRLRRVPRGPRCARRGLDRGGEDADPPGVRTRTGLRLRARLAGRLDARREPASPVSPARTERAEASEAGRRRQATRGVRGATGVPLPLG